jgi:ssDNA-binding Zn-finger/Zn-ribbon topoisomerase 1
MDTLERNYQCTKCGKIHRVKINKVWDLDDEIYYETYCPKCAEMVKHLDVGENELDMYELYDPVMDKRMY